jgi:hypothetical protein
VTQRAARLIEYLPQGHFDSRFANELSGILAIDRNDSFATYNPPWRLICRLSLRPNLLKRRHPNIVAVALANKQERAHRVGDTRPMGENLNPTMCRHAWPHNRLSY